MKIPIDMYNIGLILLFVGTYVNITAFYLQIEMLFYVGLSFSMWGVSFLVARFIKNRKKK